jgi:hypothetical protein
MSRTLVVVLLSLVAALTANARQERWSTYTNERSGFRLTYPASLIASREPDNGDGREFHSRDREFSVTASGHFFALPDQSLDTVWREDVAELGGTVRYKRKTRNWFVISGTKDGRDYYRKFYSNGSSWVLVRISYSHAQNHKYEAWVKRIEKDFVPFPSG